MAPVTVVPAVVIGANTTLPLFGAKPPLRLHVEPITVKVSEVDVKDPPVTEKLELSKMNLVPPANVPLVMLKPVPVNVIENAPWLTVPV